MPSETRSGDDPLRWNLSGETRRSARMQFHGDLECDLPFADKGGEREGKGERQIEKTKKRVYIKTKVIRISCVKS